MDDTGIFSDHGQVCFYGDANASYQRHLSFDYVVDPTQALPREQFEALSKSIRDFLSERWIKTNLRYQKKNPKFVYYLSMEFLVGRSLANNISNLLAEPLVREAMKRESIDWHDLVDFEPDAGLGNGGLGRLAACFVDSMATLHIPAIGYGLRYEYGMFRQRVENGYQVEEPDNWLRRIDPWEVFRPNDIVDVNLNCTVELQGDRVRALPGLPSKLLGVPYDRPVVGYGGETINTLRLWGVATPEVFDYKLFNAGDVVGSLQHKLAGETITRVLYPDDSTLYGRGLRFLQEYFLVACSLSDIIARFRSCNNNWNDLPDRVAIQLNDTHPAMAVAELMRILLDKAGLSWERAWDLTQRTLAYTNHTLLPEALEKWPIPFFERAIPRQLEIIYEINRRFLDDIRSRYPDEPKKIKELSLIEEATPKQVRMANLAIVGTHSTNGVAKIHSDLVKSSLVPDFYELFPKRFNNKTNGVTPRRWLLQANPYLSKLITDTIGDGWVTDMEKLKRLLPLAKDHDFQQKFLNAKREAKVAFANWYKLSTGDSVHPDFLFDCQIKRIHEYKRQLLNVLHIVVHYNRLRQNPNASYAPRVFFFAGKAAPAYTFAKQIIKLINNIASVVNNEPSMKGKLKVVFLADYNVSLAERLIPAADISEQISTAGYEASGTSNMKFMMNGALTVGTRDGATIEMAEEAGEENFFLFGLSAEDVVRSRGWYDPNWHYQKEAETKAALDLILSGHFNRGEYGIFDPILDRLLKYGDYYMHLADLKAYCEAHKKVDDLYLNPAKWAEKAIINVACSGKFSSDRTIRQYADEIWGVKPVEPEYL